MGSESGDAPRRASWIVWLAAAIGVFAALSPRDLWAPDEPRYGRIAYDMERGGDWLVSRWNGEFDAEKPPLVYWLMALTGRLGGEVDAVAARVPCALLAGLAVLLVASLARRWFGDRSLADTAALLYATTALLLWNTSRAGMDLPMTAFVLLATRLATSVVARPSVVGAAACGASLGLALLAKGPHAFYVPVGALIGGCVASGSARRLRDPRWLVALLAAIAVFAAWLVPALMLAEPAYVDRLVKQLGSRLRGVGEPHVHGFGHLLLLLLAAGLPWTPLWLIGLVRAVRWRGAPASDRFGLGAAAVGALLPLLLLELAASKRDVYLIPVLAPLAILAAYALHRAVAPRAVALLGRAVVPFLGLLALAAAAAPFALAKVWPEGGATVAPEPALGLACAVLAGAGAIHAFRRRADPLIAVRTGAAVLGVLWVVAALGLLGRVDAFKTWDEAVPVVRRAAGRDPFVTVGFNDSALVWAVRPDLVPEVRAERPAVPDALDALFAPGAPRKVAAVEARDWDAAVARIPSLADRAQVVWRRRVGMKRFVVVQPRP